MVSDTQIRRLLADAVSAQQLADVAKGLSDATVSDASRTLIDSAIEACEAISVTMEHERAVFLAALDEADIAFETTDDAIETRTLQYHACTVKVDRSRLSDVVKAANTLGYHLPITISRSQISSLAKTGHGLNFVRADEVTTRLRIEFLTRPPLRLPKALTPGVADFGFIALPPGLGLAYSAIKPVRQVIEKVKGVRSPLSDIDFLGTPPDVLPSLFEAAHLIFRDRFVDLGCGDGRVAIAAAEQTGCPALGIELNPELVAAGKKRAAKSAAHERVRIVQGDIFEHDIRDFTVVFMFLPEFILIPLLKTLKPRVDPQARIVCHEQAALTKAGIASKPLPLFSKNGITVAYIVNADAL